MHNTFKEKVHGASQQNAFSTIHLIYVSRKRDFYRECIMIHVKRMDTIDLKRMYYRVAKTHRMPYLIDHFPQISH